MGPEGPNHAGPGLPLGNRRAVQACNPNKGGLSHYPERPTPPVLYVRWPQSAFHSHNNDTSGPELRPFSETSQTPREKTMVPSRESPSNHSSVGDLTCVSGRSRRHTKAAILGRNPSRAINVTATAPSFTQTASTRFNPFYFPISLQPYPPQATVSQDKESESGYHRATSHVKRGKRVHAVSSGTL